jgi:hypothetical protein
LFQITARRLYGIQDPLCGMKGYWMELYRVLGWFDSYRSMGTELMLHAVRHGACVAQFSVPARERVGHARIGKVFGANFVIMRASLIGLSRHFT